MLAGVLALAASPAPATAGDTARGAQLYQLCAQCHADDATGNPTIGAPSLAGLQQWYIEAQLKKFRAGLRGNHPEDMPGLRMRPMALTLRHEGDIEDVASHIASLASVRPTPLLAGGDSAKGGEYFKTCLTCHGPEAGGNQELKAPRLAQASDWYLLTQLKNFKEGRRGTDPKDAAGLLMRPMSFTLPDEQAMKDVIAYIGTLSSADLK